MARSIVIANSKKISDMTSGEVRWTDVNYVHLKSDGTIVIDNDAPLSRWPYNVRIYRPSGDSKFEVTVYHDPTISRKIVLR